MNREELMNLVERKIRRESSTLTYIEESDVYSVIENIFDEYGKFMDEEVSDVIVDIYGRMYWKGFHVGWLRKNVGTQVIKEFLGSINVAPPVLIDDFINVEEK